MDLHVTIYYRPFSFYLCPHTPLVREGLGYNCLLQPLTSDYHPPTMDHYPELKWTVFCVRVCAHMFPIGWGGARHSALNGRATAASQVGGGRRCSDCVNGGQVSGWMGPSPCVDVAIHLSEWLSWTECLKYIHEITGV